MRNEDESNFKAIALIKEKYLEESSFSNNLKLRETFNNCIISILNLNQLYTNHNFKNSSNIKSIFNKMLTIACKLYLMTVTFLGIIIIYYIYIYVSFI